MKIGFDGKRAAQNFTGLGNYSRYALEALVRYYPGEVYDVYIPKDVANTKLDEILLASNGCMRKRLPGNLARKFASLWRVWGVSNTLCRDGIQVYHGLSNELPLNIRSVSTGVKSVVTVHDVIFRRLPRCYPVVDRMIYDFKFRRACQNANHIIAVSECTKRDIVKEYGVSPSKISVIYQGCDPAFERLASAERVAEVRAKYVLPRRFVLSVGTIEERKNLLSLVKSLLLLPDDIHLVVVGRRTKYTSLVDRFVAENNLERRVHLLHGVSYVDLPVVYQCADVFAYLSLYEGFGIPLLEALNSRVPVVAAKGSCLEEAGGPGSVYVAPFDVEGIVSAIKCCLIPEVKAKMIADGLQWASRFSMERFAQQTMQCYRNLLNSK